MSSQGVCSLAEYEMLEFLGNGADGEVRRCFHRKTGEQYACKRVPKIDHQGVMHVRAEISILSDGLQYHENIVRLHAHAEDHYFVCAVLELCRGGDLFDRIDRLRRIRSIGPGQPILTRSEVAEAFFAIAKALHFCHSRCIMHQDVKVENILLPSRDCPLSDLKLADFASAADFSVVKTFDDPAGTDVYQAPEIVAGKCYNETVDIWSLGVLLYTLLFNRFPFTGATRNAFFHSVQTRLYILQHTRLPVSDHARDLLLNLLQIDPGNRASLHSVLAHPWICSVARGGHIAIRNDLQESHVSQSTPDHDDQFLRPKPLVAGLPSTPQAPTQKHPPQQYTQSRGKMEAKEKISAASYKHSVSLVAPSRQMLVQQTITGAKV
ncbi:hypothetical protein KP509_1Z217000 [Ceratopteris richardii]|nr:hypothetical protein KP509_1Z217000 [Ceratopteris richardii]